MGKFLRNTIITIVSILAITYGLFLVLPFILSPALEKYVPQISEEIEKAVGLKTEFSGIKLVTTPKLTVGAEVGKFRLYTPDNNDIVKAGDFQVKMSLIPLLAKRIEVDIVRLKNIDLTLNLNKDGSFEIEKYFPQTEETPASEQTATEPQYLPMGLKLSNHLPDIKIDGYNIKFVDISDKKSYVIKGNKAQLTDFVFNKGLKIALDGNFTLAEREQFKYNLKIHNKIMPDTEFNELVFNPQPAEGNKTTEEFKINILDIFKGLYDYKFTADISGDMTIDEDEQKGCLNLTHLSVAPNGLELPEGAIRLALKGSKIEIDSDFYTAKDEVTKLTGEVKTGKNPKLDLTLKSGADLGNLVKIVNAYAMTFNIKDLQTLSAKGRLDADFNIKSDLKTLTSGGYLKIPSASIRYGLYNISIDNINADVTLDNNNININNIGFSIFNQPLKLYGTIMQDASADLHLLAENLNLKGLIIACGQAALLKDNQVNSGLVTLKADIVGKLDNIKPTAKVILSGLNIKNIPANTVLQLPKTDINIISDGKTFSGNALSTSIKAINPAATVIIPKLSANIKEDVIEITQTPVTVDKIKFNLSGKIKNYLSEKINLDFVTAGDIKSTLTGSMNVVKQTLNLNYSAPDNCTIIIPMFDKSKMTFNGNIGITGSMMNPQLSGTVYVPYIDIPEAVVTMNNITAKLRGDILNGSASVEKFVSGGIAASDITTDFSMKGEYFYLNNLKANSFEGKIAGDIVYNMANAKTSVTMKGEGMNAEQVIAGSAGIKNALSGTLSFNTKLNLIAYPDYNDMMKSLKGDMSFRIEKGTFGNIGRLEHFFGAANIVGNVILKNTVGAISNLAGIKSTAEFSFLSGKMTFSNGWANLENIKSAGATLSYFVSGKYNLINGTANVVILGRLDGKVVKLLGPLGELSAEKILTFIPKLGVATVSAIKSLTTDPSRERTSEIPSLTAKTSVAEGSEAVYKDFKVEFNGGVESKSSVKSFKWLTKADTSQLEQPTVTETVKSLKTTVKDDVKSTVSGVKNTVDSVKSQAEILKNSANELRNLFKSTPQAVQTVPEQVSEQTPAAETEQPAAQEQSEAAEEHG